MTDSNYDEKLEEIKNRIKSFQGTIKSQRENYAEWAQDSNNAHLSSPTASDNTIRKKPLFNSLYELSEIVSDTHFPITVQSRVKSEYQRCIDELQFELREIDRSDSIDEKEEIAQRIDKLVDDLGRSIKSVKENR